MYLKIYNNDNNDYFEFTVLVGGEISLVTGELKTLKRKKGKILFYRLGVSRIWRGARWGKDGAGNRVELLRESVCRLLILFFEMIKAASI